MREKEGWARNNENTGSGRVMSSLVLVFSDARGDKPYEEKSRLEMNGLVVYVILEGLGQSSRFWRRVFTSSSIRDSLNWSRGIGDIMCAGFLSAASQGDQYVPISGLVA